MANFQWDTRKGKCGPFQNTAGNLRPPHLCPTCVCNKGEKNLKNVVQNYIMKTTGVREMSN